MASNDVTYLRYDDKEQDFIAVSETYRNEHPEERFFLEVTNTHNGLYYALAHCGLEVRMNKRSHMIEMRLRNFQSNPGETYALAKKLSYEHQVDLEGWLVLNDALQGWLISQLMYRCMLKRPKTGKRPKLDKKFYREHLWTMIGYRQAVEDPFAEYLENLPEHDGKERLRSFLLACFPGAKDTELTRELGARILLGAIARTYHPGCVHDWILLLAGDQKSGKSSFVSLLVPEEHRFVSNSVSFDQSEKEQVEGAGSAVFLEFEELSGLSGSDLNKVKKFLSTRRSTVRLAYRMNPEVIERMWIGIGTANDEGNGVIPKDESGSRRFGIVDVTELPGDWQTGSYDRIEKYLSENRDQLWSEAVDLYWSTNDSGRAKLHLIPDDLYEEQQRINAQFEMDNDVLTNAVAQVTSQAGSDKFSNTRGLFTRIKMAAGDDAAYTDYAVRRKLRTAGWRTGRAVENGVQVRGWYSPKEVG